MGSCVETDFLWKSLEHPSQSPVQTSSYSHSFEMYSSEMYSSDQSSTWCTGAHPHTHTHAHAFTHTHTHTHTHTPLSADRLGPKNLAVCMAHGKASGLFSLSPWSPSADAGARQCLL